MIKFIVRYIFCYKCLVLAAVTLSSASLSASEQDPVFTKYGKVLGVPGEDTSIRVFKGIPFAAPPINELRWNAPEPPLAWQGVRKADTFSKSCMQNLTRRLLPWTEEYMIGNNVGEDCLALNVWVSRNSGEASANQLKPVLVYIHGGAYTGGSGEVLLYNGEKLAKKGIVVVTVNYRLGVFGFLAHPELSKESVHNSSGNYGLLDNIAALQWVQDNIEAFGGDPKQVTIAGQSAGAASIHYLTASPLAKNLFHRAIAQSGPWSKNRNKSTLKSGEARGINYMQRWGIKNIEALRNLSPEEIQKLEVDFPKRFLPINDGWVLPQSVTEQHKLRAQNDVPMLMGLTADEGSSNPGYRTLSKAEKKAQRDQGVASLLAWAKFRSKYGKSPTYLYFMKRATPWPEHPYYGAFHSSDIPYVFNNLHLIDRPWQDVDKKLAELMSSYWVNFIRSGTPNAAGIKEWSTETGVVMQFDTRLFK